MPRLADIVAPGLLAPMQAASNSSAVAYSPAVVAHSPAEPASAPSGASGQPKLKKPLSATLSDAGRKALGGGLPGAVAMTTQVLSLMWMRTTINYQYRYGTNTTTALKTLYAEGGVRRFYRGLGPALLQGPLSRFGDTAANAGTLALLDSDPATASLPIGVKTMAASAAAGAFRVLLMPIDTMKTIMQVEGQGALTALGAKVKVKGPGVLYHGALAASAATFVGHYPWFATYNYLNAVLPRYEDDALKKLGRSALIGFSSSFVSDVSSNSIRVIKTTKQTSKEAVTYAQAARMVIDKDGYAGLFGRGLKTKILANGMQGIMFSIVWRMGQDWYVANIDKGGAVGPTTTTVAAKGPSLQQGGSAPATAS